MSPSLNMLQTLRYVSIRVIGERLQGGAVRSRRPAPDLGPADRRLYLRRSRVIDALDAVGGAGVLGSLPKHLIIAVGANLGRAAGEYVRTAQELGHRKPPIYGRPAEGRPPMLVAPWTRPAHA